ncbi:anaerobic ribonucleoside-triphosphate reductase activating protein [Candidatus Micrarchaeota archaeon]|nr:anaerobic ribonucleoside-triphosphate reductase activating protein [Candidatus Micrarchaeota archaeon]
MEFGGIQKTSLIDYPAKIAVVLFTKGCNYACSYCHNPHLAAPDEKTPTVTEEEALEALRKRRKYADALVVTGGEPTLQKDLPAFLRKARGLGYLIKLDTNGSNPLFLSQLLKEGLLDYVALDLKAAPEDYPLLTKSKTDAESVRKSAEAIKKSGVDYEFRTTVVPGLHEARKIKSMSEWVDGGKRLFLQRFRPGYCLDPKWNNKNEPTDAEMKAALEAAKPFFKEAKIR